MIIGFIAFLHNLQRWKKWNGIKYRVIAQHENIYRIVKIIIFACDVFTIRKIIIKRN